MKYPVTEFLKAQFLKDQNPLATQSHVEIEYFEFVKHRAELESSGELPEIKDDRAAYRALTHDKPISRPTTKPDTAILALQQLIAIQQKCVDSFEKQENLLIAILVGELLISLSILFR